MRPLPATDFASAAPALVAPLAYIVPQETKPVFHSQALTGGEAKSFFATESVETPIGDLRLHADEFTLDLEGFALRIAPTAVADLWDDAAVETAYHAEIEALLKAEYGASRVVVFDATRRSDGGGGAANRDGRRGAAKRIHVDYTAASGPQRARDALGADEFEALVARGARIVQVNVWRPIAGPVRRAPLALAEAGSIRPEDLVATDQMFPDRVGEIYHLAFHPDQRWWHAPEMTRDEVLLIKGWDSDETRARFTPHTAFALPDEAGAPARESIEVRAYVVIE
ncbi:MAG: CmcJ/NvfI family oxidoreductase [Pikeienuella sp.]|uniref:CmcJ/NvfI family oxidoreductase n=1 Tax=Pikeienuella sp. TaxID=2831957 RepID=UPI00391CAB74